MGEIIGAGVISHVPTIMMPEELRYELNEGREISLVPGLDKLRAEVFDVLQPDVILVLDTHWFTTVEFIITGHERRNGIYTSEELPRGISQVPYDMRGDPEFAEEIAEGILNQGVRCIASRDPHLPVHYPTINLAHYLEKGESWLSMGICQTARDHNFLAVGAGIGEAVSRSEKRVILLASGGMSHRFWPLDELEQHEASDPVHVRTPEARAADEQRIQWWQHGEHDKVIGAMDDYRIHRPEGMFGHYLIMVGALGGAECKARGRLFSEYENATGTGQVHVWFDRPDTGWDS